MTVEKLHKMMSWCEEAMAISFYALIFFLPITIFFTETFTVTALAFYIIKRGLRFAIHIIESGEKKEKFTPFSLIKTFLQCYKPVPSALNKPIGYFLLICAASILISHKPELSLMGFLGKILQSAFIYFNFVECINNKKRLSIFLSILFISFGVVCANGLTQRLLGEGFIHHIPIEMGRISSSMRAPNDFGTYLISITPIILSILLFLKRKEQPFIQSAKGKVVLSIMLFMAVLCLGFTYSRGSWLAFLITCTLLCLYKRKFVVTFLLTGILVFSVFASRMIIEREQLDKTEHLFHHFGRTIYWQEAINIIKDYPLLGTGINTYSIVARDYKLSWGGYPHNCFLQMTAEIGLIGISVFLWILFMLYKGGIRHTERETDPWLKSILLGGLAGFSAFLVQSFFDTSFYSVQLFTLLWILMGLIVAVERISLRLNL